MPETEIHQSVAGNPDFRRLWAGLTVSQAGSAVGGTALPLVAVSVLHATTFAVTLLAAAGSVATVVAALPVGRWVEFHRKRPVLVAADVIRLLALASVPAAWACDRLTVAQLGVVAVINAVAQLVFLAASQAHLVDLVTRPQLVDANGRLQASTWLSLSLGPAAAGVIISVLGAVTTVVVDAVSYLASAVAVLLIQKEETPPRARAAGARRAAELLSGLCFLLGRADLRRQLWCWFGYAGAAAASAPLNTVFYIRELHFTSWQYGLIMGVPSLAGFAGSRLTRRIVNRLGSLPAIRRTALLRCLGFLLIPAAGRGWAGVLLCGLGFGVLLFFGSMSNAALTSYRQLHTPDALLARVSTSWSFAQGVGQPVFILLGGMAGSWLGVRVALVLVALVVLLTALALPATASG